MAPRVKKLAKLDEPTDEEIEKAQQVLAQGLSVQRSKMASFAQWLEKYDGPDKADMQASRGARPRQTQKNKPIAFKFLIRSLGF